MIYFFYWNSKYLLKQKVDSWKSTFLKKYWDFNFIHIKDLSNIDKNSLLSSLTWISFLSEKKLVIIDNFPFSWEVKDEELMNKAEFLVSNLDKVSSDTFVLFNCVNPDKRTKIFKTIKNIAEISEFNLSDNSSINSILEKKYSNEISKSAIDLIVKYKSWNLEKIVSELDKLFLIYDFIDEKQIIDNLSIEFQESIFLFIDYILNLDFEKSINILNNITDSVNIYYFYNGLLSNLRTTYFIMKMKSFWDININESLKLWNRWFLVNKRYKISLEKLEKLYLWLIEIDKKIKTWKLLWNEEKDIKIEIEKSILDVF